MGIDVYHTPGSPPSRSVVLAAKALGVDVNLKLLDLMKGEHLKPEYLKINPQHLVPAIDDNGFILTESRAIITYLADKYGKDDSLYPKDVQKRAFVNQRLYFDATSIYQAFAGYYYPVMFGGGSYDNEKKKTLDDAFGYLDLFLKDGKWVAGDNLTLADIALVATVSSAEAVGYEVSKYPNVAKWLAKAKTTLPGYAEINEPGIQKLKAIYAASKKP
uniref:Uncharacterized protein n=1 Tax=Cuerna arida TaxID=1464854 RepID=A0A1B6EXA4_9HEMI